MSTIASFRARRSAYLKGEILQMYEMMGSQPPELARRTLETIQSLHSAALVKFKESPASSQTFFARDTPEMVKLQLTLRMQGDTRIRIWYGDTKTGKATLDEHDVTGYVSRTTGTHRAPLLVNSKRSMGGLIISSNRIVRIDSISSGRTLYKHEKFHVEKLEVVPSNFEGYAAEVITALGKSCLARFKSLARANNWVAFMNGDRYAT